jgi:hypothetical protein
MPSFTRSQTEQKMTVEQFCAQGKEILNKCARYRSPYQRLKTAHEFYRWFTQASERDLNLLRGHYIITVAIVKLEELTNQPENHLRMGKVPAKKYKKILERYL